MTAVLNPSCGFAADAGASWAFCTTAFRASGKKMATFVLDPQSGLAAHARTTWTARFVTLRAPRDIIDNTALENGAGVVLAITLATGALAEFIVTGLETSGCWRVNVY